MILEDTDNYDLDDLRREAAAQRRTRAWAFRCQCDNDMPGRCPGPRNCPLACMEGDDA
jgi:hypothetical protein